MRAPGKAIGQGDRTPTESRFAHGTRPPDEEPTTPRAPLPPRKEPPRITAHVPLPEHPALADYLVESGIISRERLRVAQAYQRSMKVQLATAVVTLGLASPQKMEWAVVAHRAKLAGKL